MIFVYLELNWKQRAHKKDYKSAYALSHTYKVNTLRLTHNNCVGQG